MNTAILGTGSYLPETVLTSAELGRRLGIGGQWIVDKTRIVERRVAHPDEAASDLATQAAQQALQAAGITAADLDLIVVATSTPDYPIPSTACLVQANLGASRAAAFDIDAVCSGFLYALVSTHAMLSVGPFPRTALVIGSDVYSRILDYTDRKTCVLFGDGAGAVVLGQSGNGHGLLGSTLGSDGTTSHYVRIPGGGSRLPATKESLAGGEHYFKMLGREVRALAGQVLPELVRELMKCAEADLEDVDLLVPHQANGVMLEDLADTLGLAPGVMHLTVERYGNTGAASVPITLDDAVRKGLLKRDDLLFLIAFGGGMTWGGAAMRWALPKGGV
ncbi:ketoacyl-ACP synthase III [Amycolatopsis acidicola]|uniref:Ketoacyl-ACP synthase III n=1 Tax=Amycolatopsis acidicola TaxID=2596893 RepID=A0A5N0UNT4_9PSEU|nr:beta-ketoacyl-ACP synthase III [Amycolatopsis acidicola]KAA9151102.1 ketoacyl-ACP synthase III [Amycolatopsis acidicola]